MQALYDSSHIPLQGAISRYSASIDTRDESTFAVLWEGVRTLANFVNPELAPGILPLHQLTRDCFV